MNRREIDEEWVDLEDRLTPGIRMKNMPGMKNTGKKPDPKQSLLRKQRSEQSASSITEQLDAPFKISYKASRHEAVWLEDSLRNFLYHRWFDDVVRLIKGGKEASVYLCKGNDTSGEEWIAAKVYRPRQFRNLRNDFLYREGRSHLDESGNQVTNSGKLHAIHKRTEYGRELLHTSWLEHEFKTLQILKDSGADVPRPLASDSNAILMTYFGDAVMGAPTLSDVDLDLAEAKQLFERVVHNIDLMLSQKRIHADLSAFNILYWDGEIVLIDFPQSIHPDENRSAYRIFERDVFRVCEYFQRQGVKTSPRELSAALWQKHQFQFVPDINPKALGEDRDDERDIWESLKNN